jgi:hypothetical protein
VATDEQERRNERARSYGFRSDYDMRQWANQPENRPSIERGKQHVTHEGHYNPMQAKDYWEKVGHHFETPSGRERENIDVTGRMRHDAMAYLIEWEDMTEEEALDAMRDMYGDSGEEQ